jgi:hypothetical protein
MVAVELIGVPAGYWVWIVILALPVTALGVLVFTLLEHVSSRRCAIEITKKNPIDDR